MLGTIPGPGQVAVNKTKFWLLKSWHPVNRCLPRERNETRPAVHNPVLAPQEVPHGRTTDDHERQADTVLRPSRFSHGLAHSVLLQLGRCSLKFIPTFQKRSLKYRPHIHFPKVSQHKQSLSCQPPVSESLANTPSCLCPIVDYYYIMITGSTGV